jgi:methyltransferase family protein
MYQVLTWVHQFLKPSTYVEIGIESGASLRLAQPPTVAVGIDSAPLTDGPWFTETRIFRCTSTEFFRHYDLRAILIGKPVAFAFVDGLHLFDQALEDFYNLERLTGPGAILALHDSIPLDRETSSRERTTEFHTGDVWKALLFLRRFRPELEIVTVVTAPTGLTLIRGLDFENRHTLDPACVGEIAALDFTYFEEHAGEFVGAIANQREAVEAFCQNTPVQSILSSGAEIPFLRR